MSKLNQQKICSVIEGSGGASLLLAQTFDTWILASNSVQPFEIFRFGFHTPKNKFCN